jgi:uncharacterized protein (TIGR02099 family)
MPTPLRRRLRLARRGLWYVLALGLVSMALMAGVVSQLLPLAERHPDRIAAWLSARAGRPVTFDRVETQWTRRGPLLRLDGMRVGEGRQVVLIGDAEMLVSQYAGLLPGRSFTELRLRGLDLTLEHTPDAGWAVRGLPGQDQQPSGDPFDTLQGLGELQVIGASLTVLAPDLGLRAHVPRVDVRLRVDGQRVRAGARAWAVPGTSTPLEAVIDFNRVVGSGRAYFAARHADLSQWTPLLKLAGVSVVGGGGRAEAWADLRRHRVASITVDASLDNLQLQGARLLAADGSARSVRNRFPLVQVRARWRAAPGGWRLDAPLLRIGSDKLLQKLDGLVIAGGEHYGLMADRVDAGPLLAAMALSDRISPRWRRWLLSTRPTCSLRDVLIQGSRSGGLRAHGRIDATGFDAVGNDPGLSGLAGNFQGDDRGFSFRFDPARPMRFDWPAGFGVAHTVNMQGAIAGWRDAGGWRIATSSLHLRGSDFGATLRGGLLFKSGGGSPRIDLSADVDDAAISAAKGFWVRHLMSAQAVQWLDTALVSGIVHDGHAVISGDLSDWPFAGTPERMHSGVFDATATIRDATLKFQPAWPALEHMDADVAFEGDGFHVVGKGVLAGVGVRHFDGAIAHFGKPELIVQAHGGGDASRLLSLLRHSPLQATYGDTLDHIAASGLADVTFNLQLPLHDNLPSTLAGTVALAGAHLAENRWNIAFDAVRGNARYGNGGFAADKLAVMHDGQPGRLSLRAGDFVRDRQQAFEADLDAALSADALLQRAPQLLWLKPYVDGRSAWTVGVAIPRTQGKVSAPSHLQLRSTLIGTAFDLPAPLRKAANVSLPATIQTALPLGSGETSVTLGNVVAVRARSEKTTGVSLVFGGGRPADPPVSGLVAGGRATTLDALEWMLLAKAATAPASGSGTGNGLPLRAVDVTADRLMLLGSAFPETRLQVSPAAGAIGVQVQGNALAGTLRIPDDSSASVSGQFQRVYWRGAATPPNAAARGAAAVAGDMNPASVPPLSLDVAQLHFNDADLGSATLRTHATAGGLHIDKLQMRSPKQRIDLTGDWSGRGAAARTHLVASLDSDDFGALLAGLGYAGQVAGGHGTARLDAAWAGSPAAFGLASLSGGLHIAAREGQLVEVEPGAGRVLGLLSLAQLPRRLTLDFHDLFSKGFAFDRIDGDVRIGGGQARSDNLVIDGPAAEIRIRGAADLVAQQFDETIDVFPKAGNLLTVAGAIAGGPVGAAIGAAANAMLKKPLGRLAAKTYRVTGPWKDPKVETITRQQSRLDARTKAPPAG